MDQSASIVRGIYHYHAVTLDWGDIGYNFLVDKWGRAFEGRKGTLSAPAGKMVGFQLWNDGHLDDGYLPK